MLKAEALGEREAAGGCLYVMPDWTAIIARKHKVSCKKKRVNCQRQSFRIRDSSKKEWKHSVCPAQHLHY